VNRKKKMELILKFINENPESHASHTICRRILNDRNYEFGEELSAELKDRLEKTDELELDFFYYMVN